MIAPVPAESCEVLIIGAGPAGISAAIEAARAGCAVTIVDAGRRLGGQYFRQPADPGQTTSIVAGRRLLEELSSLPHTTVLQSSVWAVGPGPEVHVLHEGPERAGRRSSTYRPKALILATGAYDRTWPVPGWDLPGVTTVGGAQALLKEQRLILGSRICLSGTGPFLLPVAAGLAAAGAKVVGVFEANRPSSWVRHLGAVLRNPDRVIEGACLARTLIRHSVPVRTGRAVIRIEGNEQVEAVVIGRLRADHSPIPGTERRIEVDAVGLGVGFSPHVELALRLGCASRTGADGTCAIVTDDFQRSTVPGVLVAGEINGIGGWKMAADAGRIAGMAAAAQLGRISADRLTHHSSRFRARRNRRGRFAEAMLASHPVRPGWTGWLTDETTICRCEEVTAGQIRSSVSDLGATDQHSVKMLTRAGMGRCQGRMCELGVRDLISAATGRSPQDPAFAARRTIAIPVPLGVLAEQLPQSIAPQALPHPQSSSTGSTDNTNGIGTP